MKKRVFDVSLSIFLSSGALESGNSVSSLAGNDYSWQSEVYIRQDKEMSTQVERQLYRLETLLVALRQAKGIDKKIEILDSLPDVQEYLSRPSAIRTFLTDTSIENELSIKSIIAIGQADLVFNFPDTLDRPYEHIRLLLEPLVELERFYEALGGIVGYHATVLQILAERKEHTSINGSDQSYFRPEGVDLTELTPEVWKHIYCGLEGLEEVAEIYPVGGAADRLGLKDERTGEPLPSAKLPFQGITLLEALIRDLQAKEYLFYKLYGKQVTTPVAMMTSPEKGNSGIINRICVENGWFGRPKESFRFFEQPLTPVITQEGDWCLSAPLHLVLKPGGHGVIWKLALDKGVYIELRFPGRARGKSS